jgi:hypothetical protein
VDTREPLVDIFMAAFYNEATLNVLIYSQSFTHQMVGLSTTVVICLAALLIVIFASSLLLKSFSDLWMYGVPLSALLMWFIRLLREDRAKIERLDAEIELCRARQSGHRTMILQYVAAKESPVG